MLQITQTDHPEQCKVRDIIVCILIVSLLCCDICCDTLSQQGRTHAVIFNHVKLTTLQH